MWDSNVWFHLNLQTSSRRLLYSSRVFFLSFDKIHYLNWFAFGSFDVIQYVHLLSVAFFFFRFVWQVILFSFEALIHLDFSLFFSNMYEYGRLVRLRQLNLYDYRMWWLLFNISKCKAAINAFNTFNMKRLRNQKVNNACSFIFHCHQYRIHWNLIFTSFSFIMFQ